MGHCSCGADNICIISCPDILELMTLFLSPFDALGADRDDILTALNTVMKWTTVVPHVTTNKVCGYGIPSLHIY